MTPLYRQKSGYTLIELIMVISVIILLASVVMQAFSGQKSAQFSAQFEQMVTAPAKVRSLALNSSTVKSGNETVEPHGYGLFIDRTSIKFFADLPGANMNIFNSGDFVFESDTITINSDFEIEIKKGEETYTGASLIYLAPNADMVIKVIQVLTPTLITRYDPVTITLQDKSKTFIKAFKINKISGIVEPLQ